MTIFAGISVVNLQNRISADWGFSLGKVTHLRGFGKMTTQSLITSVAKLACYAIHSYPQSSYNLQGADLVR